MNSAELRNGFGELIRMAKRADRAIDQILERQKVIEADLKLVGINITDGEYFESANKSINEENHSISLRTRRGGRLSIALISDVPGLTRDPVILEIVEDYSCEDLNQDKNKLLKLTKYSYTISYRSELVIDPSELPGDAQNHWDLVWLCQRKFFRFDGRMENESAEAARELRHRNQHPKHHFHPSAERHLRFPVGQKPSVLSVACFALISFDHETWVKCARANALVLADTKLLLPHVVVA